MAAVDIGSEADYSVLVDIGYSPWMVPVPVALLVVADDSTASAVH